jgi:hypothetical protein
MKTVTFLDALVDALTRAGEYNKNDAVPPAAILWLDQDRQWEPLIPRLRERLPLFTLGKYAPAEKTGPAYWLRCVIARTLPEIQFPNDATPILYLPGVSKQELRAGDECPRLLQPLVELQYRGVLWTHKNGREWSVAAFLQASDGGLGIQVSADNATKEAMQRALLKLADEPVENSRRQAPLRSAFFDALLNPDEIRNLLLWLNDPAAYKQRCANEEWIAFCQVCKNKYGFHPEQEGAISAAQMLGNRQGQWDAVWRRYAEAPLSYPNLPDLLRRARPQTSFFDLSPSWPQDNENAETQLRRQLSELREKYTTDTRSALKQMEAENAPRREWVWAELGQAPLAKALQYLNILAVEAEQPLNGATVSEIATAFADWGWRVDAAVIDALAAVERREDVEAIKAAIAAAYRPWLEQSAIAFQKAIAAKGYIADQKTALWKSIAEGTCILFSDALRFDAGQRLATMLQQRGFECKVDWHLAALPTITPTAKPAISPVADKFTSGDTSVLEPVIAESNTRVNADVLRQALLDAGYQILGNDALGDATGRAWTELGEIDAYGHTNEWKIAHHLSGELRELQRRIQSLLEYGWKRVIVVTDHGWLMLPNGLPKSELPQHLTEIRKGRCARLKEGAQTEMQTASWHWDKNVRIAFAPGINCFESGKEYEHGGLSPQECVVPVLAVSPSSDILAQAIEIKSVVWRGLRCAVTLAGKTTGVLVDIRSKAGDPGTSLAEPRAPDAQGNVSLLVTDDDLIGTAAFIVVVSEDGTIQKQQLTTVGG